MAHSASPHPAHAMIRTAGTVTRSRHQPQRITTPVASPTTNGMNHSPSSAPPAIKAVLSRANRIQAAAEPRCCGPRNDG